MTQDIFYFEPEITDCEISLQGINTLVNTYQSGASDRLVLSNSIGYWALSINLISLSLQKAKQIFAFLCSQQGRAKTFKIRLREFETQSKYTGVIQIDGLEQTGNAINVKNMNANTVCLHSGDFIKFANHSKVYQVKTDLISNTNGLGTLVLTTPVAKTLSDNESIEYRNFYWTMANADDIMIMNVDLYLRSNPVLNLQEVWK